MIRINSGFMAVNEPRRGMTVYERNETKIIEKTAQGK